jgi:hypothetical protein
VAKCELIVNQHLFRDQRHRMPGSFVNSTQANGIASFFMGASSLENIVLSGFVALLGSEFAAAEKKNHQQSHRVGPVTEDMRNLHGGLCLCSTQYSTRVVFLHAGILVHGLDQVVAAYLFLATKRLMPENQKDGPVHGARPQTHLCLARSVSQCHCPGSSWGGFSVRFLERLTSRDLATADDTRPFHHLKMSASNECIVIDLRFVDESNSRIRAVTRRTGSSGPSTNFTPKYSPSPSRTRKCGL